MFLYQKVFSSKQLKIISLARKTALLRGQKVYLVGGTVRDLLLCQPEVDIDLAVEGNGLLYAKELSRRLSGRIAYHERFLTATIYWSDQRVDIVTTRSEYYPFPGALPEIKTSSLMSDLGRRDFSVNAMALPLTAQEPDEIIDPFNGRHDLYKGVLRTLHANSFKDDPSRIFRGVRLANRLKFIFTGETEVLVREALKYNYLDLLDPKRYWHELYLILKDKRPVNSLQIMVDLGWPGLPGLGLPDISKCLCAEKLLRQWQWLGRRKLDSALVYFLILTVKLSDTVMEKVLESLNWGRKKRRLINNARKIQKKLAGLNNFDKHLYKYANKYEPEIFIFVLATAGETRLPAWIKT